MLAATHIIVFSEKVVFRDVGAQQGVAHQVDKAQTQALESRYGAGKEQVGSHTAEPRPSPSDLQSRKGAFQGVVTAGSGTRIPVLFPGKTAVCLATANLHYSSEGKTEGAMCGMLVPNLQSMLEFESHQASQSVVMYRTTSNFHSCSNPGGQVP